ncbi:hypothetical protein AVEN_230924-1 [Araneus ventricosus]|uniref:Uncharacterized protein n=1 Tax=Araneus ventricosus TaxID=182803 RepID=A0A4Y2A3R0_ARAVE|nr:hypothetical protein AVEN_230924-1 [Araneus ventricosus]
MPYMKIHDNKCGTRIAAWTVAVYCSGARLVPEGPQILFDTHRTADPTWNLRHWIGGGASKQFCAIEYGMLSHVPYLPSGMVQSCLLWEEK